jgi:hypothetical protein
MPIVAATTMPRMIELTESPNIDTMAARLPLPKNTTFSMGLFVLVALSLVAAALGQEDEVRCFSGSGFFGAHTLLRRSRRHSRKSCKWALKERACHGGGCLPFFSLSLQCQG